MKRVVAGSMTVKLDGARVFTVLLTREEARLLRRTLNEAQAQAGQLSSTGRANPSDLVDLIVAGISHESNALKEQR